MSERWVCRLVNQPRGTQRYQQTQREDEDALTRAIVEFASEYGCYGYRRLCGRGVSGALCGVFTAPIVSFGHSVVSDLGLLNAYNNQIKPVRSHRFASHIILRSNLPLFAERLRGWAVSQADPLFCLQNELARAPKSGSINPNGEAFSSCTWSIRKFVF